jgi:hypothetical protein
MNENLKSELYSELIFNTSKAEGLTKRILNDDSFEYDEYEDKELNGKKVIVEKDKNKWSKDYYVDQVSLLQNNFSRERLQHILDVKHFLTKKKIPQFPIFFLVVLLMIAFWVYEYSGSDNKKIIMNEANMSQEENQISKGTNSGISNKPKKIVVKEIDGNFEKNQTKESKKSIEDNVGVQFTEGLNSSIQSE